MHTFATGQRRLLHEADDLHALEDYNTVVAEDETEEADERDGDRFANGVRLCGDLTVFILNVARVLSSLYFHLLVLDDDLF